ncbi:MAG TPA: hypothetical protein VE954_09705 [Oligoflexus sp.]|uniref:hypothetical protein n=1 Tax=Oligoflexus sp. TaxID=1971216 RepID=UPI002D6DB475|nr:hypothetical protein [Oligoflexus sp.]HYX33377.1 hypothetical protein [Oligoflexus sp.]
MPHEVADMIYSEGWRSGVYIFVGGLGMGIAGGTLTKNHWGAIGGAIVGGALGYYDSTQRNPEWEHDRNLYNINRDYNPTVSGSKADMLNKEHKAARDDFAKKIKDDPENADAVGSGGLVNPDKLTLEARQAYDRQEMKIRHEREDLAFEKQQRIDYEKRRYALGEKYAEGEISDAQYKEGMTNLGKKQDSDKNKLESRQANERSKHNEQ